MDQQKPLNEIINILSLSELKPEWLSEPDWLNKVISKEPTDLEADRPLILAIALAHSLTEANKDIAQLEKKVKAQSKKITEQSKQIQKAQDALVDVHAIQNMQQEALESHQASLVEQTAKDYLQAVDSNHQNLEETLSSALSTESVSSNVESPRVADALHEKIMEFSEHLHELEHAVKAEISHTLDTLKSQFSLLEQTQLATLEGLKHPTGELSVNETGLDTGLLSDLDTLNEQLDEQRLIIQGLSESHQRFKDNILGQLQTLNQALQLHEKQALNPQQVQELIQAHLSDYKESVGEVIEHKVSMQMSVIADLNKHIKGHQASLDVLSNQQMVLASTRNDPRDHELKSQKKWIIGAYLLMTIIIVIQAIVYLVPLP